MLRRHHVLKIINEVFVIAIVSDRTWIPEVDFLEAREKGERKGLEKYAVLVWTSARKSWVMKD